MRASLPRLHHHPLLAIPIAGKFRHRFDRARAQRAIHLGDKRPGLRDGIRRPGLYDSPERHLADFRS
jgi:aminoglycoside phosphotransferase